MSRCLCLSAGILLLALSSGLAGEPDLAAMRRQWESLLDRLDSRAGFAEFREFYAGNSPDLLEQWHRRNQTQEQLGALFLERLARDFVAFRRLRTTDPDEYRERIRILREESALRSLGRRIAALKGKTGGSEAAPEIQALLQELRSRLRKSFEDSQQRQQLELLRLETEVRRLRKIVESRAHNKDFILRQRMEILCGSHD